MAIKADPSLLVQRQARNGLVAWRGPQKVLDYCSSTGLIDRRRGTNLENLVLTDLIAPLSSPVERPNMDCCNDMVRSAEVGLTKILRISMGAPVLSDTVTHSLPRKRCRCACIYCIGLFSPARTIGISLESTRHWIRIWNRAIRPELPTGRKRTLPTAYLMSDSNHSMVGRACAK